MTSFQRAIVAVAAAALVLAAFLGRYEVVIGSRGDATPPGYLLDRWTGHVQLLVGVYKRDTFEPKEEAK